MKLVRLIFLTATLCACATTESAVGDTVAIVTVGDDGLTQRLADAVEANARSARFTISTAGQPASLTIRIPTHVGWENVGSRMRVKYRAEFQRRGVTKSSTSGECWDNELSVCASQIVAAAIQTPR